MTGTKTLHSPAIASIRQRFTAFLLASGIPNADGAAGNVLRGKMFDFLLTEDFRELYFRLATDAAAAVGLDENEFVFQTLPTPRIFRPGEHGTSFHCDYWYGHGEKSYTVWTPLSDIDAGNTFLLCNDDDNQSIYEQLVESRGFIDVDHDILAHCYPAMPASGSSIVFNSKIIHGSPKNTSSRQRLSFDFRIGPVHDETSTKDLHSYFHKVAGKVTLPDQFKGVRYLKYVCGGPGRNTFAQQFTIEAAAKNYSINIVAQEAEIERLGYPMLEQYLSDGAHDKGFDAIIISSRTILDAPTIELAMRSRTPVYCVLENVTLNRRG